MFENKNQELTPISTLGEFGLIKHLTQFFPVENTSTELGVGDDAAIINAEGKKVLVSTDMFTEGVHFNLGYTPLKHLGYKVVVAGISDIAAMNAVPTQIMISVAVSNRFPVEALEEIYVGVQLACRRSKVDLVGGDTTSSQTGLVINVTTV